MPITKADLDNAKQDDDKRKADAKQAKLKAEEKESNEGPRKALGEAVDYVKKAPEELMRGIRRVGQDLGIAEDTTQYKKTPQGEIMANSDIAKGARNEVRLHKEGMGMRAKNDEFEKKNGGSIKAKAYAKGGSVSSASSRGDGIAQRGKTKGKIY